MPNHRHLQRLSRVWIPDAIYFVTACARNRRPIFACPKAADILRNEWESAKVRHGWLVGRYVIMPDHVHFFCAEMVEGAPHRLSRFIGGWKEWTAKAIGRELSVSPPIWQERFFDHLMRTEESYAEKWAYVRDNPVRAGLSEKAADWPWQGHVDFDCPL